MRMRNGVVWCAAFIAMLLALVAEVPVTLADWIDPDTPSDAFTTVGLSAHPPPKAHKDSNSAKKKHRRKHKHNVTDPPTASPSEYPTQAPTPYTPPRVYDLVFSDEFNTPYRSFVDGHDSRWTALNKNDYTNNAQHYYHPDNAYTNADGELVIKTEAVDTEIIGFDDVKGKKTHVTKHFRSAMIQTWNKFCFTGGVVEAEVLLPGKHDVGGLWPAFWLLGNLARHTYVGSSSHVWPWSSSECTAKGRYAQLINGCANVQHFGMEKRLGRGAPEIDIFEVQPGNIKANTGAFLKSFVGQPFMSSSYQVAPGRAANRPGNGEWPGPGQWYEGLTGGNETALNILFYGDYNHFNDDTDPARQDYFSDAISYNRQLHETHFERHHKYRIEWELPSEDGNGTDGYLHWFLDDEMVLNLNGTGLKESGLGSEVSTEPMYIILNTAVSSQWGFPSKCPTNCPCKHYDCHSKDWKETCGFSEGFCNMLIKDKPEYLINYIRVYQDRNDERQKVGCSTPERPTRTFIKAHSKKYMKEGDDQPLKKVQVGQGRCNPGAEKGTPENCGGPEKGVCTDKKVCECNDGWVGPHCLSHDAYDDIIWDEPDSIWDIGFIAPSTAPSALVVGFALLAAAMFMVLSCNKRLQGWSPIPDTNKRF